jgi:hypothetical protein
LPPKDCEHCNKVFQPARSGRGSASKHCSIDCANAARKLPERACGKCGTPFLPEKSKRKYCSTECGYSMVRVPKWLEPKPCPVCGKVFAPRKKTSEYCSRACRVAQSRGWGAGDGKSSNARSKGTRAYGHTEGRKIREEFLAKQGGECHVCREQIAGQPALDHCHVTGMPRAVLCARCNLALGMLKENPERIQALYEYALACIRFRDTQDHAEFK